MTNRRATRRTDSLDRRSSGQLSTLLHVATVPLTLRFLRDQICRLPAEGLVPHVASAPGDADELAHFERTERVFTHPVPMTRKVSPFRDLRSLIHLSALVQRLAPTVVHAHTPKAGLLGMVAAAVTATPVRIYQLRGLPHLTSGRVGGAILRAADRLACRLAHRVICVSPSLRAQAITDGVCAPAKIEVLGSGSGQGVDLGHFAPERFDTDARGRLLDGLGIPHDAEILGFVGRLVRDKGVVELAAAWAGLRVDFPKAHLLMLGPSEDRDATPAAVLRDLRADSRVHVLGLVADPAPYYAIMDVVALPTAREGFPNVLLEAAAMEVAVVASAVDGCTDAVRHRETGWLVEPGSAAAVREALERYLRDPELRARHGRAARARVEAEFSQDVMTARVHARYRTLVRSVPRLRRRRRARNAWMKRAFDVWAAAAALALSLPIALVVAVVVAASMGRPIFFRQLRPGLHGKIFRVCKFRTMSDEHDRDGMLLPDERRLGRVGRWLRSTGLDELPQLWSVLRGDMSIVGPRPLLVQYLDRYTPDQAKRHDVKPGLTGWAQIHGRNAPPWDVKFAYDQWYAEHGSFLLDLWILARSATVLLSRAGVGHGDLDTMPEFQGSAPGGL